MEVRREEIRCWRREMRPREGKQNFPSSEIMRFNENQMRKLVGGRKLRLHHL